MQDSPTLSSREAETVGSHEQNSWVGPETKPNSKPVPHLVCPGYHRADRICDGRQLGVMLYALINGEKRPAAESTAPR